MCYSPENRQSDFDAYRLPKAPWKIFSEIGLPPTTTTLKTRDTLLLCSASRCFLPLCRLLHTSSVKPKDNIDVVVVRLSRAMKYFKLCTIQHALWVALGTTTRLEPRVTLTQKHWDPLCGGRQETMNFPPHKCRERESKSARGNTRGRQKRVGIFFAVFSSTHRERAR